MTRTSARRRFLGAAAAIAAGAWALRVGADDAVTFDAAYEAGSAARKAAAKVGFEWRHTRKLLRQARKLAEKGSTRRRSSSRIGRGRGRACGAASQGAGNGLARDGPEVAPAMAPVAYRRRHASREEGRTRQLRFAAGPVRGPLRPCRASRRRAAPAPISPRAAAARAGLPEVPPASRARSASAALNVA